MRVMHTSGVEIWFLLLLCLLWFLFALRERERGRLEKGVAVRCVWVGFMIYPTNTRLPNRGSFFINYFKKPPSKDLERTWFSPRLKFYPLIFCHVIPYEIVAGSMQYSRVWYARAWAILNLQIPKCRKAQGPTKGPSAIWVLFFLTFATYLIEPAC